MIPFFYSAFRNTWNLLVPTTLPSPPEDGNELLAGTVIQFTGPGSLQRILLNPSLAGMQVNVSWTTK